VTQNQLFSLDGKFALVTGSGKGIGHEIARSLLDAGAELAAHYRSSYDGVQRLISEYGSNRCFGVRADFDDHGAAEEIFSAAWERRNRIDILVNCAALIEGIPLQELTEEDLTRTFRVNAAASFLLTRRVVQEMRRVKQGRVVTISSIGVKFAGSPQTAHYMISKAAQEAATLALGKSAAADGVLVNVVRAGVARTDVHDRLGRDMSARESLIPMKRAAHPSEIANAVLFLVSPANSYMTNAVIPVSGGE
jgi:3-oxoacyl-[acyl-carrier protein] reductase